MILGQCLGLSVQQKLCDGTDSVCVCGCVSHVRVKPLHYISWLIGHEGTGSILSLLRKK